MPDYPQLPAVDGMTSATPAQARNSVHPRRTADRPAKESGRVGADRTADSVIDRLLREGGARGANRNETKSLGFPFRMDRNIVTSAIVAVFRTKFGYAGGMGAGTVLTALAGSGVLLAVMVVGIFLVLGRRDPDTQVSERLRRFFTDRRRDGRGF
jgi:hypothetical protein